MRRRRARDSVSRARSWPPCRVGAAPAPAWRRSTSQDLKEWLTYIASDELEGRAVFSTGIRPGRRLHRGPPARLGRQAGRRPRVLSADGARARRQDDQPFDRHRDGRGRRPARSRTATAITFPKNAGGKRTVHRRPRRVRRLRPRCAGRRPHGFSRQERQERRRRLARRPGTERPRRRRTAAADRPEPLRDRAARCGREHRAARAGAGRAGGAGTGRRGADRRQVGRAGRRRAPGSWRAAAGGRLHDRAAPRFAAAAERVGRRCVLRVSLQPRADALRRAETQGARRRRSCRRFASTA